MKTRSKLASSEKENINIKPKKGQEKQKLRATFVSQSPTQTPTIEARFMAIEDGLSRHRDYIHQNLSRIPYFETSEEAEQELKKLLKQLKNPAVSIQPIEMPDITKQLNQISKQHQTLSEEEERIAKLRAMTDDTKAQEEAEYITVTQRIESAKKELADLQQQVIKYNTETSIAQQKLNKALSALNSRERKMAQLHDEENRLLKLQKQSRQELKSLQAEINDANTEESVIADIESQIEINTRELKRMTQLLNDKRKQIKEKNLQIQKILNDTEAIETKLDEAVGFAGTVTEKQKNESYLLSESSDEDQNVSINSRNKIPIKYVQISSDDGDTNLSKFSSNHNTEASKTQNFVTTTEEDEEESDYIRNLDHLKLNTSYHDETETNYADSYLNSSNDDSNPDISVNSIKKYTLKSLSNSSLEKRHVSFPLYEEGKDSDSDSDDENTTTNFLSGITSSPKIDDSDDDDNDDEVNALILKNSQRRAAQFKDSISDVDDLANAAINAINMPLEDQFKLIKKVEPVTENV